MCTPAAPARRCWSASATKRSRSRSDRRRKHDAVTRTVSFQARARRTRRWALERDAVSVHTTAVGIAILVQAAGTRLGWTILGWTIDDATAIVSTADATA